MLPEFEEPEESSLSPEDGQLLLKALAAMREDDQAMLVAHFAYGYTEAAIAEAEGICKQAVHQRIVRALRRTRERLGIMQ